MSGQIVNITNFIKCINGPDCIELKLGKCRFFHSSNEYSIKRVPCKCGGIIGTKNAFNKFTPGSLYFYCSDCKIRINLRQRKKEFLSHYSLDKLMVYYSKDFDKCIPIYKLKEYLRKNKLLCGGIKTELLERVKNHIARKRKLKKRVIFKTCKLNRV